MENVFFTIPNPQNEVIIDYAPYSKEREKLQEEILHQTMEEEIPAPVLTVFIYEDEKFEETLKLRDTTSPYALTGAILATNRHAVLNRYNQVAQWCR